MQYDNFENRPDYAGMDDAGAVAGSSNFAAGAQMTTEHLYDRVDRLEKTVERLEKAVRLHQEALEQTGNIFVEWGDMVESLEKRLEYNHRQLRNLQGDGK